jgi:hypothetical protein
MEDLENALRLAEAAYGQAPCIEYRGGSFHYNCHYDFVSKDNLQDIVNHIEQGLFERWKNDILNAKNDSSEVNLIGLPVQVQKGTSLNANTTKLATRQEWSKGKAGDPRGKTSKNRKNKRYSKTQVLSWMRQRTNGRFSSETISFEQYVKEFLTENRKAESRRNWRKTYGKKKNYDDKILALQKPT